MKKFSMVLLLALTFFMFPGISQAGKCIYLGVGDNGDNIYYDSNIEYSGSKVSIFTFHDNNCTQGGDEGMTINCANNTYRCFLCDKWEPITHKLIKVLKKKYCK